MLISRTTGWVYKGFDNPGKELVDNALALIRQEQDEAGLDAPAAVSEDAQRMLTEAAEKMPELGFWHDVTKEWDAAIYLFNSPREGCLCGAHRRGPLRAQLGPLRKRHDMQRNVLSPGHVQL